MGDEIRVIFVGVGVVSVRVRVVVHITGRRLGRGIRLSVGLGD